MPNLVLTRALRQPDPRLYQHAFRLSPLTSSDLVADCFELAWDIRTMDMRAAPYDLSELGLDPIRIETAARKQGRAAAQRVAPLRERLVTECERLPTHAT